MKVKPLDLRFVIELIAAAQQLGIEMGAEQNPATDTHTSKEEWKPQNERISEMLGQKIRDDLHAENVALKEQVTELEKERATLLAQRKEYEAAYRLEITRCKNFQSAYEQSQEKILFLEGTVKDLQQEVANTRSERDHHQLEKERLLQQLIQCPHCASKEALEKERDELILENHKLQEMVKGDENTPLKALKWGKYREGSNDSNLHRVDPERKPHRTLPGESEEGRLGEQREGNSVREG